MKQKKKIIALCAGIAAAAVLAVGFLGWQHYQNTYITIDGIRYERSIISLDLSGRPIGEPEKLTELTSLEELDLRDTGITVQEYEALKAFLPDCHIRWSLPFQGGFYDNDTQELTITTLTEADIALLDYLPDLSSINATGCQDYDQLLALQARFPDCEVSYNISLGGEIVSRNVKSLTFDAISAETLAQFLPHFTQLESVTLTGSDHDTEALLTLSEAYPEVAISWEMEVCGVKVNSLATELDLSDIPLSSISEVEAITSRMPRMEKVIMSGCGISNEEMDALNRRHEDVQYVWTVNIGPFMTLRTDDIYFAPVKLGYQVTNECLENLKYCTELICIDLGHMPITDCSFLACTPHVQYLVLGDTKVRDITAIGTLKELKFLELFLTEVRDYAPLLGCTALEDLNLCYTVGDSEIIGQMTWLKRLWWNTGMTNEQLEALIAALPDTKIARPSLSSTDLGWRQSENYYAMRDILGMPYMQ